MAKYLCLSSSYGASYLKGTIYPVTYIGQSAGRSVGECAYMWPEDWQLVLEDEPSDDDGDNYENEYGDIFDGIVDIDDDVTIDRGLLLSITELLQKTSEIAEYDLEEDADFMELRKLLDIK